MDNPEFWYREAVAHLPGNEMRDQGPFTWVVVLALGVAFGILLSDGAKLAITTYTFKRAAAELAERQQREREEAERAAKNHARAVEQARRVREIERRERAAEHQKKTADFQHRNEITESTNKQLQSLQDACDQAHEQNRKSPSRENTLRADKICSGVEAEKAKIQMPTPGPALDLNRR